MSFRYYNPVTGRYLSRDPLGYVDGPNVYAHVKNNPVNRIDPLGLAETDISNEEAAKLKDMREAINKKVQGVIDQAYADKRDPVKAVREALGEKAPGKRLKTTVEHWADTFTPEGKDEKHEDYVLNKTVEKSKYAGAQHIVTMVWAIGGEEVLNAGINVAGEAVGTDKLGHFFQQGLDMKNVKDASGDAAAEKWNRSTEYMEAPMGGVFGQLSTGVMSKADMEANRQGAKFYGDLQAAHAAGKGFTFDIGNYMNANWNENKNPNDYTPRIQTIIDRNAKP